MASAKHTGRPGSGLSRPDILFLASLGAFVLAVGIFAYAFVQQGELLTTGAEVGDRMEILHLAGGHADGR